MRAAIPALCAVMGSALLAAAPIPGPVPPQLAFQYAVGQSFRYHLAGGHTSTSKHSEHAASDYVVHIQRRDGAGWHATEVASMGGKSKTFPITISDSGVWTSDADGTIATNLVSFDPRTLCLPPSALSLHLSWPCERLGTRLHPAGTETITVTALSADGVTLDVTGSTPELRDKRVDPDNGGTIDVQTKTTWHQVVTFSHGRQIRVEERDSHRLVIPGTSARGETVVTNVITSE